MENLWKTPKESVAESAWNVAAVNQILRNTDLGNEFNVNSTVFKEFNITPDDQSIGDFLLKMPVPVAKNTMIQFKWIIINKRTCQYIDDMKKPAECQGFHLVDESYKIPNDEGSSVELGVDYDEISQAWHMIKEAKVKAGNIEKRPYHHEVIKMGRNSQNGEYDPTLEKFIQNFLTAKNIAVHLMEDIKLNLEGKHIFEVLKKTKIDIFVRKLALQMVMVQAAYFPLKEKEDIEKLDIFNNWEAKATEHFCSQMLMAMSGEMFNLISNITPDTLESEEEIEKAVKIINDQFIDKFLISHDGTALVTDPTDDLIEGVNACLEMLQGRWPKLSNRIGQMRKFLTKGFKKEIFVEKALIQLSNMLAFLITKPEWLFNYAPHLALNERLCVHLAENFEINRLNTKVRKIK